MPLFVGGEGAFDDVAACGIGSKEYSRLSAGSRVDPGGLLVFLDRDDAGDAVVVAVFTVGSGGRLVRAHHVGAGLGTAWSESSHAQGFHDGDEHRAVAALARSDEDD